MTDTSIVPAPMDPPEISFSEFRLEEDGHRIVTADGRTANLPNSPYKLLAILASKPNNFFSRATLAQQLGSGRGGSEGDRSVDQKIRLLRDEFEKLGLGRELIVTERGFGRYKLVVQERKVEHSTIEHQAAHSAYLTSSEILSAREILVTIPDFRYFRTTHPDICNTLAMRISRSPQSATVISADRRDLEELSKFVEGADDGRAPRYLVYSLVDAWPYSLFLEPASAQPSCWVLVTGGFLKIDGMRTEGMLARLRLAYKENVVRILGGESV
jgi:DNA-binding winged helix-turn-helix (wHTH) protein